MARTTTVVCVRQPSQPAEAVCVEQWPLPEPAPHQVVVETLASPINPADLNHLEGTYGVRPQLPAVLGMEGVGLSAGQHVIAPVRLGWWCSARILDAADVFPIPADISLETAAMLTVNPPTAYRMLMDFESLQPGDWIIQNAANSAVGRCVIQLARHHGWRTLNIVRRPELATELQALGADVVVTEETLPATGEVKPRLGLNAVGGDSARLIARSLAPHGTFVTYGAMARQPVRIDNGPLIFNDLRVRGFWISEWYRHATRGQIETMLTALVPLARTGQLTAPVEQFYPLEQAREAVTHAQRSGRAGKILFRMD